MTRSIRFGAIGILLLASPGAARALTHVGEYAANLDNYRYCVADPLATCSYDDTRSPSSYHLTNNTKGSVAYGNGVAKVRIDSIEVDTAHPAWTCHSQTYACGAAGAGGCGTGKKCQAGPDEGQCCSTDADCQAVACDGGPQDDTACTTDSQCEKIDGSKHWNVVLRGNQASFALGQPLPLPFLLRGDDGTGCVVACEFSIETSGSATIGSINSNGRSCQMSGDCQAFPTFHHVEIVDPDGNVVAIPSVGSAVIVQGFPMTDGDPAKVGDACLTVVPTPADCP